MTNLSNKAKQLAGQAVNEVANVSPTKVVRGTSNLLGTILKGTLQGIGATAYVASKATKAGLAIGKKAYDEAKAGYQNTDDLLSSEQEQPTRSHPVGSDAVRRPQQMEFDFNQSEVK